jgi:hypothetical protein
LGLAINDVTDFNLACDVLYGFLEGFVISLDIKIIINLLFKKNPRKLQNQWIFKIFKNSKKKY